MFAALLCGAGLALALAADEVVLVNRASGSSGAASDSSAELRPNAVSGDLVVFSSTATNLPSGNGSFQVYLRDTASGTTELVSEGSGPLGPEAANGSNSDAVISGNGRFVAFASTGTNLVPGDNNGVHDIFRFDRVTGLITLVSLDSGDGFANDDSRRPSISADGSRVAYWSEASDLVASDSNAMPDAFVRDLDTNTTTRVSVSSGDAQGTGQALDDGPEISADGSLVAFSSSSADLAPGDSSADDTYELYARSVDGSVPTHLISVRSDGASASTGISNRASMSADGRFIAFASDEPEISPGVSGTEQVFIRDRVAGTTTLVGRADGAAGAIPSLGADNPSLSDDGRLVAFSTEDAALNPVGSSGAQIHLRDVTAGTTKLISRLSGVSGAPADDSATTPALSPNGATIAFQSEADNLAAATGASADNTNVFLRNLVPADPAPPAPPAAPAKPKLISAKLTPSKFRPVKKGRRGGGSKLRVVVDQAVTITARIERQTDRAGKRFKPVGRITFKAKEGASVIRFRGVVKGKPLKSGKYRMFVGGKSASSKTDPAEIRVRFVVKV